MLETGLATKESAPYCYAIPIGGGWSIICPDCREDLWLAFTARPSVVVWRLIGYGARPRPGVPGGGATRPDACRWHP